MTGHIAVLSVACPVLGVVCVKKVDVPLGIVVVGVVLMIGCRLVTWWPGVIIGAALVLGVLVSSAYQRRVNRRDRADNDIS